MTHAPADLLAVRQYLLSSTGLSGDAVGIAGDPAHAATGGYHEGNDDLARVGRLFIDYSKRESARDRPGTDAASALDIGDFTHGAVSLRTLSLGIVSACQHGDPRTRDVREVIYTPDGSTVRRWDRLGIRSTGDSSHLYHTHLSFFRDSEGRRAAADNILGLLAELIEGVDMAGDINLERAEWRVHALYQDLPAIAGGDMAGEPNKLRARLERIETKVDGLAARPPASVALTAEDRAEIIAGLAMALGPIAQEAAEAAVRRVLGGLDGASPAGG